MKRNQIIVLENGNGSVTKAFANQARIFGTPEYKLWREFLKDNEGAIMEIRTIKKNTQKDTYRKNLTYKNMREYIASEPNSEELLNEFDNVIIKSKIQTCPYDYVANWFKAKFPDYKTQDVFADNSEAKKSNNIIKMSA